MNTNQLFMVFAVAAIAGGIIATAAMPQAQAQTEYKCQTIAVQIPGGFAATSPQNPSGECTTYNLAGKIRQCCPKEASQ